MMRQGGSLKGVTPAGVEQTVTLTVLQSWRWSMSHLHWRVLQGSREWWSH